MIEYLIYKYSHDPKHWAAKFHLFDLSPVYVWYDKQFRALLLTALGTQALGTGGFSTVTPALVIQVQRVLKICGFETSEARP